ncbi:SelT/SelW/SelH family protein [Gilvimarinus algae]|uniref:SelT/SelW/SelH family protein n=1 Tax=Gilvimarinus algae TaxID=3058037 RepID=A0ABT8TCV5_9GAMM|nr:SelT/SelW/SelH family protein [Gilvimarinus sp. SDUM040014]MDO3381937.1 SelT/SelW/SelH family protein [Gilvimarinus sp. SDUM040014]
MPFDDFSAPPAARVRVVIHYCNLCRWMLRAAWLAQELLSSFPDELDEVSLHPGDGGVFAVWLGDELVWERQRDGGFPEAKVLKQRIRDRVNPERELGHSDR